jgi:NADPH-dependent 2,4-dienoyl-CoA reductase/sulfur reductase-like enzyme
MPDLDDIEELYSRRSLLRASLGIAGAVALCGFANVLAVAADAGGSNEWRCFSASELPTIDAIVAQIIPTDDTPGAREMGVVRFIDHKDSTTVDFVVVGSGAAGGVIARELAVGGFSTVVLEQGPRLTPADFAHDELKYWILAGITVSPP